MPHHARKKQPAVKWFIQEWGTLPNETLVVVGLTQKQIVARMKRSKFHKDVVEAFSRSEPLEDASAWVWLRQGRTMLWFPEWKNDWEHYNTLLHETNHLVYHIIRDKGMTNEIEAQAYQHEYLFDNIRRRLCAKPRTKTK